DQLPAVGTVVAPLSGGGLAGGIAAVLAERAPGVRVVGASAARAAVMHASLAAGRPVALPEEETLASALAGGIGLANRVTFALARERLAHRVVVGEDAIARAVADAALCLKLLVEGGGAVALAALGE